MTSNLNNLIAQQTKDEFQTIQQVVESLGALENAFRKAKDNRGIFVVAYREMTERLEGAIHSHQAGSDKSLNDPDWMREYLLAFANMYRQALYGSVQAAPIPASWQFAFQKAHDDKGVLSLQHLMLGINAHIVHDLPLALHQIGLDRDDVRYESKQDDHNKVTVILKKATDRIQDKVTGFHFSQGFSLLEKLIGPLDELLAEYYFEQQRTRAWYNALHLAYLARGKAADRFMEEWFVWAIQSDQKMASYDLLKQQIDRAASGLAQNITRWRFPSVPGFREGDLFDQFEPLLTEAELSQFEAEIEEKKNLPENDRALDWTQII